MRTKVKDFYSLASQQRFENITDRQLQTIIEKMFNNKEFSLNLALDIADLIRVSVFLIQSDLEVL